MTTSTLVQCTYNGLTLTTTAAQLAYAARTAPTPTSDDHRRVTTFRVLTHSGQVQVIGVFEDEEIVAVTPYGFIISMPSRMNPDTQEEGPCFAFVTWNLHDRGSWSHRRRSDFGSLRSASAIANRYASHVCNSMRAADDLGPWDFIDHVDDILLSEGIDVDVLWDRTPKPAVLVISVSIGTHLWQYLDGQ